MRSTDRTGQVWEHATIGKFLVIDKARQVHSKCHLLWVDHPVVWLESNHFYTRTGCLNGFYEHQPWESMTNLVRIT